MKKIHCHTPHKSHPRDFGFIRYFDIGANPHMQWHVDRETKQIRFDYFPKHFKSRNRLKWDSYHNGTCRRTSGKGVTAKYVAESATKPNRDKVTA